MSGHITVTIDIASIVVPVRLAISKRGRIVTLLSWFGLNASMTCALVTGTSGFIGTALFKGLSERGVNVIALASPPQMVSGHLRCGIMGASLLNALRINDVDVIFHAAGAGTPYHAGLPRSYHKWSNEGTAQAVLTAIEAANYKKRVVFLSSASVYGDSGRLPVCETARLKPCTDYGAYKMSAERLLVNSGMISDLVIARIFHVYGPGQRKLVTYDLTRRLLIENKQNFILTGAYAVRDFVFISDVVRALIFLGLHLDTDRTTRTFNICSGRATSIAELTDMILKNVHIGDRRIQPSLNEVLNNPVLACVGDPVLLASAGVTLPPIGPTRLAETTDWVRDKLREDSRS